MGLDGEYARCLTLLYIITETEDSNLYRRGGKEEASFAKNEAKALLSAPALSTREALFLLDDAFVERNLSPGGAADLLALTEFLHLAEESLSAEKLFP
ncbi:MAG: triphosphoribosyl-dephospho-CoA synthase [Clostridia bacterium]|nr:triphosphoribosyl-dephospho-CoA synthase [Clostridia bacterium]